MEGLNIPAFAYIQELQCIYLSHSIQALDWARLKLKLLQP
jgi:hypothetical protein